MRGWDQDGLGLETLPCGCDRDSEYGCEDCNPEGEFTEHESCPACGDDLTTMGELAGLPKSRCQHCGQIVSGV